MVSAWLHSRVTHHIKIERIKIMETLPKYPHLILDLAYTDNGVFSLLFRFQAVLKNANPPIEKVVLNNILTLATALEKEQLLKVIHETVTVITDADDGSNAAIEAIAQPLEIEKK